MIAKKLEIKDCPKCRLVNPASADVCDCGYSFSRMEIVSTQSMTDSKAEYSWVVWAVLIGCLVRMVFSFTQLGGIEGTHLVYELLSICLLFISIFGIVLGRANLILTHLVLSVLGGIGFIFLFQFSFGEVFRGSLWPIVFLWFAYNEVNTKTKPLKWGSS